MPLLQISRVTVDGSLSAVPEAHPHLNAIHADPGMTRISVALEQAINRSNVDLRNRGFIAPPTTIANREDQAAVQKEIDRLDAFSRLAKHMLKRFLQATGQVEGTSDSEVVHIAAASGPLPQNPGVAAIPVVGTNAAGKVDGINRWVDHRAFHSAELTPNAGKPVVEPKPESEPPPLRPQIDPAEQPPVNPDIVPLSDGEVAEVTTRVENPPIQEVSESNPMQAEVIDPDIPDEEIRRQSAEDSERNNPNARIKTSGRRR